MENKTHKYKDELEKIAPGLAKIQCKDSFTVPENYFNDLSMRINERIIEKKEKGNIFSNEVLKRYISASVLSMIILAVSFIYFNRKENNIEPVSNIVITLDELIASSYLTGMDEFYIKEYVAGSDADLNYLSLYSNDVENYLLEMNLDEQLIIDEL
ncbi:MAG: hypothetical protein ACR2GN_07535 [Bacteroidia bacterium]